MFRKVFQALGVVAVIRGLLTTVNVGWLWSAGELTAMQGLFWLFISLGAGVGGGLLMIFFDAHKLLQTDSISLYKLVKNRAKDTRSFSEKIHVEENEEEA